MKTIEKLESKRVRLGFNSVVLRLSACVALLMAACLTAVSVLALTVRLTSTRGAQLAAATPERDWAEGAEGAEAEPVFLPHGEALYDPERDGEVLRLHIIANSDSSEDQRIKLAVRNAVLEYERARGSEGGRDAAERALLDGGAELLDTVRSVLRREGAGYDAQLMLGVFDFPDREYDGRLYPAGEYRALRILLGDGVGKNWWCILFPPLCMICTGEQTINGDADARTGDEARDEAEARGETAVRFDSLLVRLFNKLMGNGEN